MKAKKKYQLIILSILCLFVYLLFTEIADRWQHSVVLYGEWQTKNAVTPEGDALRQQKMMLEARRTLLKEQSDQKSSEKTDQFAFLKSLHTTAKACGVRIQAMAPSEIQSKDTVAALALKMETLARYHDLGRFVNVLETGAIPLDVTKLEMISEPSSHNSVLDVFIEGKVLLPVEKIR
jgi:Tfp pilus assembly protein PilO